MPNRCGIIHVRGPMPEKATQAEGQDMFDDEYSLLIFRDVQDSSFQDIFIYKQYYSFHRQRSYTANRGKNE